MAKLKIPHLPLIIALTAMMLPMSVKAEENLPPTTSAVSWTGNVFGKVVNLTAGASVPDELELMLHTWDPNLGEKEASHVNSKADGSYLFEEILFSTGDWVSVMAFYEGAIYMSQPVEVQTGIESISLDIPIYESTSDLSMVKVDQMHVFIMPDQGGLSVSEVYVISNRKDRTVMEAGELEDGTPVTLKFTMQADAHNLSFDNGDLTRYVVYEGGFADTAPLLPGEQSTGIMLSYLIPYENEGTYLYRSQLPTGGLNFLIPIDSGLALAADGLEYAGTWPMRDGNLLNVYEHSGLPADEVLRVKITGAAVYRAYNTGSQETRAIVGGQSSPSNTGLGIGGAAVGIALIAVGFWWWRRMEEPDLEEEDSAGHLTSEP